MTDEEVLYHIKNDTRLNKVRVLFSGECGRIERAFAQRRQPTPVEHQRMEFEAVRKIAAALGTKL